jgi:endonuclease/exonuclease/phosphatase family metal-dependent hydrolase
MSAAETLTRTDWTASPQERVVERLTEVPVLERHAAFAGPKDPAIHRRLFDRFHALREIEIGGPVPRRAAVEGAARILCWNVERLRHADAVEAVLRSEGADIALLSEVDRGMARSGNRDCIADLSERLHQPYAYALEFIELDLGDPQERRDHAGESNRDGFHGAALIGDVALQRPFLIRLEATGEWFDGSRYEPRIGGTIALGAQIQVAGVAVTLVNVHLESHGDPEERAGDVRRLLAMIDAYSAAAPVLIGGDFNTSCVTRADRREGKRRWLERMRQQPDLLVRPHRAEPLFTVLAEAGYDGQNCNVPGVPTTRYAGDRAAHPRTKLDWFFTRSLEARDPKIIPALRSDGKPSSDHDALAVTIRPR